MEEEKKNNYSKSNNNEDEKFIENSINFAVVDDKSELTKKQCIKNLIVLSFSIFFLFSAYGSLNTLVKLLFYLSYLSKFIFIYMFIAKFFEFRSFSRNYFIICYFCIFFPILSHFNTVFSYDKVWI